SRLPPTRGRPVSLTYFSKMYTYKDLHSAPIRWHGRALSFARPDSRGHHHRKIHSAGPEECPGFLQPGPPREQTMVAVRTSVSKSWTAIRPAGQPVLSAEYPSPPVCSAVF